MKKINMVVVTFLALVFSFTAQAAFIEHKAYEDSATFQSYVADTSKYSFETLIKEPIPSTLIDYTFPANGKDYIVGFQFNKKLNYTRRSFGLRSFTPTSIPFTVLSANNLVDDRIGLIDLLFDAPVNISSYDYLYTNPDYAGDFKFLYLNDAPTPPSAVPVPATAALFLSGLAFMGIARKKKAKA